MARDARRSAAELTRASASFQREALEHLTKTSERREEALTGEIQAMIVSWRSSWCVCHPGRSGMSAAAVAGQQPVYAPPDALSERKKRNVAAANPARRTGFRDILPSADGIPGL